MASPSPLYEDDLDFEQTLTPARDERPAPVVLIGAVVAFVIGIALWGSLTMSIVSGVGGFFGGDDGPSAQPLASEEQAEDAALDEEPAVDCLMLATQGWRSPADEALYQDECAGEETEAAPATPADVSVNREDCEEIRGTEYRSPGERVWFLENCVS